MDIMVILTVPIHLLSAALLALQFAQEVAWEEVAVLMEDVNAILDSPEKIALPSKQLMNIY